MTPMRLHTLLFIVVLVVVIVCAVGGAYVPAALLTIGYMTGVTVRDLTGNHPRTGSRTRYRAGWREHH